MFLVFEGTDRETCEIITSTFLRLMLHLQNEFVTIFPDDHHVNHLTRQAPRMVALAQLLDFYDYEHRIRELMDKTNTSTLALEYYRVGNNFRYRDPRPAHVFYFKRNHDETPFTHFAKRNTLSYTVLDADDPEIIYHVLAKIMPLLPHPNSEPTLDTFQDLEAPIVLTDDDMYEANV